MRTQVIRRFLWSAYLLIIVWLLALDVYVTQQDSALMYPLMGASLA